MATARGTLPPRVAAARASELAARCTTAVRGATTEEGDDVARTPAAGATMSASVDGGGGRAPSPAGRLARPGLPPEVAPDRCRTSSPVAAAGDGLRAASLQRGPPP